MTEAYRRDNRMNSFAYHLFIDAFPEGWMKTLMDVERNPKKAFFAYRDTLAPVLMNLRTDRFKLFAEETAKVECWVCNDTSGKLGGTEVHYQVFMNQRLLYAEKAGADIEPCASQFQGFIEFKVPDVKEKGICRIQAALVNHCGNMINSTELMLEVFPKVTAGVGNVCLIGGGDGRLDGWKADMDWKDITLRDVKARDCILVAEYDAFLRNEAEILQKAESGANLLFIELQEGNYQIGGCSILVKNCSMLPLHFASRDTGHSIVEGMGADAVRFWYDEEVGYITPLLEATFTAQGYQPILTSGNQDAEGNWQSVLAVGECAYGSGKIRICQVKLPSRTRKNPTAKELARKLISG